VKPRAPTARKTISSKVVEVWIIAVAAITAKAIATNPATSTGEMALGRAAAVLMGGASIIWGLES
jgi:hypothetical protein